MKKSIFLYILYSLIIIVVVIFLDYFNTFYFISKNLNFEFLNIFINSLMLVLILCITYVLIDKRNINRDEMKKKNQLDSLYVMLNRTYLNCEALLKIVNDDYYLKNFIVPKEDFDSTDSKFINRQRNVTFEYHQEIIDMMKEGIIELDILDEYFDIKSLFLNYLNMKITFFDIHEYDHEKAKEIVLLLEDDKVKLEKKLKKELKKLSSLLKDV